MSSNMPSNVTPMWGGGSAPPWPPNSVPPGCFSELARLNQCYNEVQMMEMILSKVVCDLATNNAAFQQCLVDAIAKSGSNVPLIGVTNGSLAQPGQVGEYYQNEVTQTINLPASTTVTTQFTAGILPPGDWDIAYTIQPQGYPQVGEAHIGDPVPPGISDYLLTALALTGVAPTAGNGFVLVSSFAQANLSVQTLIPINLQLYSGTAMSTSTQLIFRARRRR
jgi:hypothetical protein